VSTRNFALCASRFANYANLAKPGYFRYTASQPTSLSLNCLSGRIGCLCIWRNAYRTEPAVSRQQPFSNGRQDTRSPFASCWLALILLLLLLCRIGSAESSQEVEFLPEVDAYLKLKPDIRVGFQAKDTREGGDSTQAAIGPSMDFYLKPLIRLKKITAFDLDDAKSRPLVLTAGYSYLSSPNSPSTNRILIAVTSHLPIKAQLLLSDRNRADLDWSNGDFTWRYRNMLSLQRTFAIHSYHLIPYASAEFYYESQYSKWSTTELYAGTHLPLGKHFDLDPYYEHQNNTGKKKNGQVNALGLTLDIYLSKKAK
jgi:hypothetical protein